MSENQPPRLARRLLESVLREDLTEEVLGDLQEKFDTRVKSGSRIIARLNYWYEALNYLRPFAIRESSSRTTNSIDMFWNYFKISSRNILKQKLYAAINIGGLSLGIACFMIIFLYVQHEFTYNRFYSNADQIYRVYQKQSGNVFLGTDYFAVTPAQLASVMREEFPEVKYATTLEESSGLLSKEDIHIWQRGIAGDVQFFDVFKIPFLKGNPKTAFVDPKSIVLTRSMANAIFGEADPVGQMIHYQNVEGFKITGIIDDPPSNSSLTYSFIINILYNNGYREDVKRIGWNNNSYHTFFELATGANPTTIERKFPRLLKKYQLQEDYANYPFKDQYFIQPLTEVYFQSDINFDIGMKGNRDTIYLFSLVALIVLLLACVNYMNLAVARSIKRSREVGLRKVAGAVRRQLIGQFLTESVLISFLSLVLAIGLTYLVLPYFSHLMERPITLDFINNRYLLPGLLLLVLWVGIFSGSYPAFIMSSLKPIEVLKVKADVKVSGFSLQRSLLVIQFAASITLIISSLIIFQQLKFMRNKELGYDKNDVVTIRFKDRALRTQFPALSHEWTQHPNILAATLSSHLPTHITSSRLINTKPNDTEKEGIAIYQCSADYNFINVFGITLIAGRYFSQDMKSDAEESLIINETAAKAMGWSVEEAIGKQVYHVGPTHIIGVVKDFHMHSMHLPIQPLMIRLSEDYGSFFSLKVKPEDLPQTLSFIESTMKKYSSYPFEYQFLSENYDQLYKNEMKLGEIFGFFTIVSILIASLGLFGLAAFMSSQRTQEIGIRKVLGASIQNIVMLVSKDFLKLVMLAFLLAIPVGWYIMNMWLQGFAYRVSMEWWTFALAGMFAFLIAGISIGYQSLKSSMMDPVDSLRSE